MHKCFRVSQRHQSLMFERVRKMHLVTLMDVCVSLCEAAVNILRFSMPPAINPDLSKHTCTLFTRVGLWRSLDRWRIHEDSDPEWFRFFKVFSQNPNGSVIVQVSWLWMIVLCVVNVFSFNAAQHTLCPEELDEVFLKTSTCCWRPFLFVYDLISNTSCMFSLTCCFALCFSCRMFLWNSIIRNCWTSTIRSDWLSHDDAVILCAVWQTLCVCVLQMEQIQTQLDSLS